MSLPNAAFAISARELLRSVDVMGGIGGSTALQTARLALSRASSSLGDLNGAVAAVFASGQPYRLYLERTLRLGTSIDPATKPGTAVFAAVLLATCTFTHTEAHALPTAELLACVSPFSAQAHLALLSVLLRAGAAQTLPVDEVLRAVARMSSPTRTAPFDLEDALLLWLNKGVGVMNGLIAQANGPRTPCLVPALSDVSHSLADGRALGVMLAYYCPRRLALGDLVLHAARLRDVATAGRARTANLARVLAVVASLAVPCPVLLAELDTPGCTDTLALVAPALVHWLASVLAGVEALPVTERLDMAPAGLSGLGTGDGSGAVSTTTAVAGTMALDVLPPSPPRLRSPLTRPTTAGPRAGRAPAAMRPFTANTSHVPRELPRSPTSSTVFVTVSPLPPRASLVAPGSEPVDDSALPQPAAAAANDVDHADREDLGSISADPDALSLSMALIPPPPEFMLNSTLRLDSSALPCGELAAVSPPPASQPVVVTVYPPPLEGADAAFKLASAEAAPGATAEMAPVPSRARSFSSHGPSTLVSQSEGRRTVASLSAAPVRASTLRLAERLREQLLQPSSLDAPARVAAVVTPMLVEPGDATQSDRPHESDVANMGDLADFALALAPPPPLTAAPLMAGAKAVGGSLPRGSVASRTAVVVSTGQPVNRHLTDAHPDVQWMLRQTLEQSLDSILQQTPLQPRSPPPTAVHHLTEADAQRADQTRAPAAAALALVPPSMPSSPPVLCRQASFKAVVSSTPKATHQPMRASGSAIPPPPPPSIPAAPAIARPQVVYDDPVVAQLVSEFQRVGEEIASTRAQLSRDARRARQRLAGTLLQHVMGGGSVVTWQDASVLTRQPEPVGPGPSTVEAVGADSPGTQHRRADGFVVGDLTDTVVARKQQLFHQRQKQREEDLLRARAPVVRPSSPGTVLPAAETMAGAVSAARSNGAGAAGGSRRLHPPPPPPHVESPTVAAPEPRMPMLAATPPGAVLTNTPMAPPAIDDLKAHSNKSVIRNAIVKTCLAGQVNAAPQQDALNALDGSNSSHFLVLLRDITDRKFQGLYAWEAGGVGTRLCGRGPRTLHPTHVTHYFRYSTATRNFDEQQTTSIGLRVDAVCLRSAKKALPKPPIV